MKVREEQLSAEVERFRKSERESSRCTIASQHFKTEAERAKEECKELKQRESYL
jgi:hypothetical protein